METTTHLQSKIRVLGFQLAWEERAQHTLKGWFERRKLHANLLRKFNKLEKLQ